MNKLMDAKLVLQGFLFLKTNNNMAPKAVDPSSKCLITSFDNLAVLYLQCDLDASMLTSAKDSYQ